MIENGRAFLDWHLFNFPSELDNAIFVYRGHGSNSKSLNELLLRLKGGRQKIGFFDYDPAGIAIANTAGVDAILVPDLTKHNQLLTKINKRTSIALQQQKIGESYLFFNNILQYQYKLIIDRNLAITQESIANHNISLNLCYFNKESPEFV